ncbi:hypothetical protein [Stenomitos frigidus]|uniref:hypothetical protein n=1 Tax=Stenomitos frigidus TaxID=1886765 RepID=UPI0011B2863F|nr:hypothetical protein [Stenomitos frigidus]
MADRWLLESIAYQRSPLALARTIVSVTGHLGRFVSARKWAQRRFLCLQKLPVGVPNAARNVLSSDWCSF